MHLLIHDYGAYHFTKQLAQEFAKQGNKVDYIYSKSTQYIQRTTLTNFDQEIFNITGIKLNKPYQKYNLLKRRQAEIEHGRKVATIINQIQPDIVISANTPIDSQKIIQKSAINNDSKFIFWFQDAIGLATKKTLRKKLPLFGNIIGQYYERTEKNIAKKSDKIILISKAFLPLIESWKIDMNKTHVIPNWAPIEQIKPHPKNNEWSKKQKINNTFNFIYTGILGLKHTPELFIKLAQQFESNKHIRIIVVSKGGGMNWLKHKKELLQLKNLTLLDFQPVEIYSKVLASADVLISILNEDASAYSVPSKVLSYLCAGRSILLSVPQKNLASKIVIESGAGLVSEPNNSKDFLKNAFSLYVNREEYFKNWSSIRKYAEKEFDISNIIAIFNKIFTELGEI